MKARIALFICLLVMLFPAMSHSDVITLRTGQVNGSPGTCAGLDDTFHFYAPNSVCGEPILPRPFQPSDFDQACSGPKAVVINYDAGAWIPDLPHDPQARWINWTQGYCYGTALSVLYCAEFQVQSQCSVADSIRIYWAIDDVGGDSQPEYPGPNPYGIYLNGTPLLPSLPAGWFEYETSAVVYNVPLASGSNRLEVYQRDEGCGVSGLILSCHVYTTCGPVPVRDMSWGSVKAIYR